MAHYGLVSFRTEVNLLEKGLYLGLVLLRVLSQNRDGFPIELFYFRNIATFPQNEVAVLLKLLWGIQGFLIASLSLGDI